MLIFLSRCLCWYKRLPLHVICFLGVGCLLIGLHSHLEQNTLPPVIPGSLDVLERCPPKLSIVSRLLCRTLVRCPLDPEPEKPPWCLGAVSGSVDFNKISACLFSGNNCSFLALSNIIYLKTLDFCYIEIKIY